jgi:hypothetical protein
MISEWMSTNVAVWILRRYKSKVGRGFLSGRVMEFGQSERIVFHRSHCLICDMLWKWANGQPALILKAFQQTQTSPYSVLSIDGLFGVYSLAHTLFFSWRLEWGRQLPSMYIKNIPNSRLAGRRALPTCMLLRLLFPLRLLSGRDVERWGFWFMLQDRWIRGWRNTWAGDESIFRHPVRLGATRDVQTLGLAWSYQDSTIQDTLEAMQETWFKCW